MPSTYSQPMNIRLDVKVPMRDGVRLSTDLYLPTSEGPFPTLLLRTYADNQREAHFESIRRFVEAGYAVAAQDCRGRFDSEGEFNPYAQEPKDGYDTQEWIGAQPWCDGNIGTFGGSYMGFTQSMTAPLRSRYLKALVPVASQQDNFGHWRVDGALQLHVAMNFIFGAGRTMQIANNQQLNWHELFRRLPIETALADINDQPFYRAVIRHDTYDDFWDSYSMRHKYGEVEAPALIISGWYDNLIHEAFKLFTGWSSQGRSAEARNLTKLLIGPWSHGGIGTPAHGSIDFGGNGALNTDDEHLRWYDRRLRSIDNGIDGEPPVRIFVMGENVWRHEGEWPLARTQYTRYYLHSGGGANSMTGDGVLASGSADHEPPDTYSYDPEDPVPTYGGQFMALRFTDTVNGPMDRRPVEVRDDVLVYTTDPLEHDVEVTGPVSLTLYASSSAPDTDFTGTLVDVHPDGKAIILCDGLLRTRYRDSIERTTLMEPGRVYELQVNIWETSNLFKAGHRIRLEVSSSNFPRFDRNLNTGNFQATDTEIRVADQTIYHDSDRPSHLTLPVIPRA